MIATVVAALFGASAMVASAPPPTESVRVSTGATASAALSLEISTFTVSTLYTGDRVRDPFLPRTTGGGPARPRNRNAPVDIHSLDLHGIMKDARSDFAVFSMADGSTFVLRDTYLYDDRNKRVPGIKGAIKIKQKRAELITADGDVQVYSLGESEETGNEKNP